MAHLKKIVPVKYFNCDLSKHSTLIISSPNGLLTIIKNDQTEHIKFDIERKIVKIYPNGDELLTTTDNEQGLRVWDLEQKKIIFCYPKDEVKYHIYVQNNIIAALTELGIKFYDLRMRYSCSFVRQKNIKSMDYFKSNLYFCTNSEVLLCENNESFIVYNTDQDIVDFRNKVVLSYDSLYFIEEKVTRNHLADKILPLNMKFKNQKILASTVKDNVISWIGYEHFFKEKFGSVKAIDFAVSNSDNFYLFGDQSVFEVSF